MNIYNYFIQINVKNLKKFFTKFFKCIFIICKAKSLQDKLVDCKTNFKN